MHASPSSKKRQQQQHKAAKLEQLALQAEALPGGAELAASCRIDAAKYREEAASLKRDARIEDLNLWQMAKPAKGGGTSRYWMASWREQGKVRNAHIGSCSKLSEEKALEIARGRKAAAIPIPDPIHPGGSLPPSPDPEEELPADDPWPGDDRRPLLKMARTMRSFSTEQLAEKVGRSLTEVLAFLKEARDKFGLVRSTTFSAPFRPSKTTWAWLEGW